MILDKKNKLLIFGFAIALYISYAFAISKTISYYKEYQSKKELISSEASSPQLLFELKQKEKQLDLLLSQYKITNSESFQNDLLKQLNTYSNTYHLKIVDFKEPHIIVNDGTTTTSYIFSLEGSFNGCLALIDKIENNGALGSIKHIDFIKKRDYKSNKDFLVVEVVLVRSRG
ncbi:MAG: general secretion pathway protein [Arcicella sp.]|nr:general secretion pathway protein [Arcicella sp.]